MTEVYRTKSGKVITDEMVEKWAAEAERGYALAEVPDKPVITLVRARQTCYACPSQWTAWDADGAEYFLHYRYGTGTFYRQDLRDPLAQFEWTDPDTSADGVISLEKFAELAGIELS